MRPAETSSVNWPWAADRFGALVGALLFGTFCWFNGRRMASAEQLDLIGLMLIIQLLVLTIAYLTRRSSVDVSWRPLDWLVGLSGTFILLLFDYGPQTLPDYALYLLPVSVIAVSFQIAGIASLGRSFGIVAANRGVKSSGMYGFVRHPIYTAYFVNTLVNLATHFSMRNSLLVAGFIGLNVWRMYCEEGVLRQSKQYCDYADRVRWRVLPGVF